MPSSATFSEPTRSDSRPPSEANRIGVVQGIVILLVASSFTVPGRAFLNKLMGARPTEATP